MQLLIFSILLLLFFFALVTPLIVAKRGSIWIAVMGAPPLIILSLLAGISVFFVTCSMVFYAISLSLLGRRNEVLFLVSLLLSISPFFIHLGGKDLLLRFDFYPLLFDPVLVISYAGDFDIMRSPFSYKHTSLADYVMFNPDILMFCLFYMLSGLFILLLNYVVPIFKTGVVQEDI